MSFGGRFLFSDGSIAEFTVRDIAGPVSPFQWLDTIPLEKGCYWGNFLLL
jgi:hypothetical protein